MKKILLGLILISNIIFAQTTSDLGQVLSVDNNGYQLGISNINNIIGGTATSSTLTFKTTTGVGATDAHIFQVGNNGATESMRILSNGRVGIGVSAPSTATSLAVSKIMDVDGHVQIISNGVIQSAVVSNASYFRTTAATLAAAFTLTDMYHFRAVQGTIGAGSTVTNQYGFEAASTLTGAGTLNAGFRGSLAVATGRYNCYMAGTAQNYFRGDIGIGLGAITPTANIHIVQAAVATGVVKGLIFTGAVNTNQTLSTEIPSWTITTAGRQWAAGALALNREINMVGGVASFVSASTLSDYVTLGVSAGSSGANATITRNWAAQFTGNVAHSADSYFGALTTAPGALIHGVKTTEQLRLGYNSTSYFSSTVASNGSISFAGSGTNTGMTFTNTGTGSYTFNEATTTTDGASSGFVVNANSLTTGNGILGTSTSLTNGSLMTLDVTGTAALDGQKLLYINSAGANAGASKTTYGAFISNIKSGSGNNVALSLTASGGSNNYGLLVSSGGGRSGFGTSTPAALVEIGAGSTTIQPLRFTTGTSLSSPSAGSMEYDGVLLYFTNNGAKRYELLQTQQSRVTTQFDKTLDVTLANITNLTADVAASKVYKFEAILYVTPSALGGGKFVIAGTASATAIIYEVLMVDNTLNTNTITSKQIALGGAGIGQTGTVDGFVKINGLISVNGAGTLTVQFAQNASAALASSILVGSNFKVDIIN